MRCDDELLNKSLDWNLSERFNRDGKLDRISFTCKCLVIITGPHCILVDIELDDIRELTLMNLRI